MPSGGPGARIECAGSAAANATATANVASARSTAPPAGPMPVPGRKGVTRLCLPSETNRTLIVDRPAEPALEPRAGNYHVDLLGGPRPRARRPWQSHLSRPGP